MNQTEPSPQGNAILAQKRLLRRQAYDARNRQPNREAASQQATVRLLDLSEYPAAGTVLWYVDCRSELRTRDTIRRQLLSRNRLVVPYCTVDATARPTLGLWRLESLDELVIGKWQILEPPRARWSDPRRIVSPHALDLVVCPGVAFDRRGHRLGNGQGYYDRLLDQVRPDCLRIGLCYDCQLLDRIPVEPHDHAMDWVVTQSQVIRCARSERVD